MKNIFLATFSCIFLFVSCSVGSGIDILNTTKDSISIECVSNMQGYDEETRFEYAGTICNGKIIYFENVPDVMKKNDWRYSYLCYISDASVQAKATLPLVTIVNGKDILRSFVCGNESLQENVVDFVDFFFLQINIYKENGDEKVLLYDKKSFLEHIRNTNISAKKGTITIPI